MATSNSTAAESMQKSIVLPQKPEQISPLHSALAAVCPLGMLPETTSSEPSTRNVLASLLLILVAVQYECRDDAWFLSLARATDHAVSSGINKEDFLIVIERVEQLRKQCRQNPLHL
jgi:hypothetical protein